MSVLGTIISSASLLAKYTTLLIISLSSISKTPSSWLTLTIVSSSDSVIVGNFSSFFTPSNLKKNPVIIFKINIIGVKINTQNLIGFITKIEIFSEFLVAKVFGVISPNINIIIVRIPVAIPTPWLLNLSIAIAVAIEEAPILTRLLPINIALNSLAGSSKTFCISLAFFIFSSIIVLSLILLRDVKAVSDIEKKADKEIKIIKIINCKPAESK